MKTDPVLYAIQHTPTLLFHGDDETNPVASGYGLYCHKMAVERARNMREPAKWEVVISPRQQSWPKASGWRG